MTFKVKKKHFKAIQNLKIKCYIDLRNQNLHSMTFVDMAGCLVLAGVDVVVRGWVDGVDWAWMQHVLSTGNLLHLAFQARGMP